MTKPVFYKAQPLKFFDPVLGLLDLTPECWDSKHDASFYKLVQMKCGRSKPGSIPTTSNDKKCVSAASLAAAHILEERHGEGVTHRVHIDVRDRVHEGLHA